MLLWKKANKLTITDELRLGKNADIKVSNADGTVSTVDLTELAAIDSIGATDLAKIDGITNGTAAAGKAVVLDGSKGISTITSATITTLTSTTGNITTVNATNVDAGASGTAGTVDVFPATASKGKFVLSCTDQTGDTAVTLKPAAMGQATQVNIADPGAAASYMVQSTAAVTLAEADVLDGAVTANSVASKVALLDANKRIQTGSNNGTPEANVTAVHYGDGINVTAVLTLTNVAITVGSSASLGVGSLLYTLPTGACLIRDAYMSVGLSGVSTTNDTPDVGLGTVIASGVITTLDGTATFENIITGQTATDTNGTAAVKGAGPTGGNPLEITTAGAHTVYFNAADGWGANADASGLLNGTVVISYIRQAA